ncbi:MAG: D-aminoacylase [SAR202 cluster bacterium]|nr:D-aminoacylase [SAR202 cluster bacterium]|tara:strand:+ start:3958 stop:5532 length:1575 start_codon:yes stop_codon:yes gene_type:complete
MDIIIKNGLIIDGTGNPGYYGNVLVDGDSITISRQSVDHIESNEVIDAAGQIVCPGFIDLHSHTGLTILGLPHHDPKIRQGVTTELIGIDGISHAPFRTTAELEEYIWFDSGLNGYPPSTPDWLTVADFLSKYDNSVAVNIAYILGNSPVRIWATGWEDKRATKQEINMMKSVVAEAMQEGAWGISTGLDYPPGSYADTNELIELSKVVEKYAGFYHTHARSELMWQPGNGIMAPWEEAIDIGFASGIPIHLTHYRQGKQGLGSHLDYLELVEDNRAKGLDVTFDCYTYPFSSTSLVIAIPQWAKSGGPRALLERLQDKEQRKKIRKDMRPEFLNNNWLTNFNLESNKKFEGKLLDDIADLRQQDRIDALFDLLIEENLSVCTVGTGTNQHTLPDFVSHQYGMIASDSILLGEFPSPRSYGCFPIVLAEFVKAEKQLKLPEAIRKMTSFPAQRLGLKNRGVLKDGFKADIVVFDYTNIKAPATKETPKIYPEGINYVIVNGKIVIDKGTNTGVLAGQSLRRGKD